MKPASNLPFPAIQMSLVGKKKMRFSESEMTMKHLFSMRRKNRYSIEITNTCFCYFFVVQLVQLVSPVTI